VSPVWWVVGIATALSGFFALNAFALGALRRVPLEEAFAGAKGHRRLAKLEEQLPALRLTCSFCWVLADLLLAISVLYLADPSGGWVRALGWTVPIVAGLVGFFGVAIPQAWANYAGENVLARTLEVLLALRYALYPVIALMRLPDVPVRRLTGAAENNGENGENAKQEILQAASEGRAEGTVDAEEVKMIASVIEFGETRAGEIMTPRTDIFALSAQTPWQQALPQLVQAGHTRVPVYENDLDNIIGILYVKDLLAYIDKDSPPALREVVRKPFFVPETKLLDDLLREFKARKVHLAVVLDEYGGTAGLVTIEDVVEEIVGEITDEYDRAAPVMVQRLDARTLQVDGRYHVDDLAEQLGLNIPDDLDYDTVAGLVFSELGYIPPVGETLRAYGAEFTVLAADERKITKVRVRRLAGEEPGQR